MSSRDERVVRYEPKPLTQAQINRIDALKNKPDSEIDFTDNPEADADFFVHAKRGTMYRLVKRQTTLRLDADVLDWFKRKAPNGKGYQTDINSALREYIAGKEKAARKKAG